MLSSGQQCRPLCQSACRLLFQQAPCVSPSLISQRHLHVTNVNNQKEQYSVGILGCGRIAGVHLKNVLKNRRFDLKWIVENDPARVEEVRKEFYLGDTVPFYTSDARKELLADKNLDATIVLSPTNTHTDYICDSLNNGKSVFTEKPAGESVSDIRRCYETAEATGLTFLTGYTRRFDPTFQDIQAAVKNGTLGKIQAIKTTTRDSPKPSYAVLKECDSTGCNILSDLGVHDIDMLVWLTGPVKPESIYVTCHIHDPELHESGQPDSMAAVIKYGNGILVTMDVFRESVYGYDIRLEAFGTKGVAVGHNPRESSTIIDGADGGSNRRLFNSFPQRFEAPFEAELDHFIDCMDGKTTPLVTKEESICVAEIIEKGVESYLTTGAGRVALSQIKKKKKKKNCIVYQSFQGSSLWKKISPQSNNVSAACLIFASFFDRFAQQRYQLTQIELFDRVSHVMARS